MPKSIMIGVLLGMSMLPLAAAGYVSTVFMWKSVPQIRVRLTDRKVKIRVSLLMGSFIALLHLGAWITLATTPTAQIPSWELAIGALTVFVIGSICTSLGLALGSWIASRLIRD